MRALFAVVLAFGCSAAHAQDIASCSNPEGHSYFPATGLVSIDDAGWAEDRIRSGLTKVTKLGEGEYDVLFVDASNEITSSRASGGHVMLLTQGANAFSLLIVYPGSTAEGYSFIRDSTGTLEYLHTQSRGGDNVAISKASVMRGVCSYIHLDRL